MEIGSNSDKEDTCTFADVPAERSAGGNTLENEAGGSSSSLAASAGIFLVWAGVLFLAAAAVMPAVLFSRILGWGCSCVAASFFLEVLLLFLYSHPAAAYAEKSVLLPFLADIPLRRISEVIRCVIYVNAAALVIIFFGAAFPDIIKFCVPDGSRRLIFYYAGETAVLCFVYCLMVKRVTALFTASHTDRYDKIRSDIMYCRSGSESESQRRALENELARIKKEKTVQRKRGYLFAGSFIIFSFAAFFLHSYLMSGFYMNSGWGMYVFAALALLYAAVCMALDSWF